MCQQHSYKPCVILKPLPKFSTCSSSDQAEETEPGDKIRTQEESQDTCRNELRFVARSYEILFKYNLSHFAFPYVSCVSFDELLVFLGSTQSVRDMVHICFIMFHSPLPSQRSYSEDGQNI